jgi:hypothetical protein
VAWSLAQRAAHFRKLSAKFRAMAESEPAEGVRMCMHNVADKYEELAKALLQ